MVRYLPEKMVGARVAKRFGRRMYSGVVTRLRLIKYSGLHFGVEYSDGDFEELTALEIKDSLDDKARRLAQLAFVCCAQTLKKCGETRHCLRNALCCVQKLALQMGLLHAMLEKHGARKMSKHAPSSDSED